MTKRILSIFTALALCLTMLPATALAVETDAEQGVLPETELDEEVWTVTEFDALAADVANQTLPQLAEDGEDEGQPNLPDTLTATAYPGEDKDDTQPIAIGVTWEAEPDFDQAAPATMSTRPRSRRGTRWRRAWRCPPSL